jgi:hypothetical protein
MKDDGKHRQALELRLKGLTYAEIGSLLGVSRQRAQQLVKPPQHIYDEIRALAKSRCADCGVLINNGQLHHTKSDPTVLEGFNDPANLVYLCIACHMSDRRMAEHGFVPKPEQPKNEIAQALAHARWDKIPVEQRAQMVPRTGGRPKGQKRNKTVS